MKNLKQFQNKKVLSESLDPNAFIANVKKLYDSMGALQVAIDTLEIELDVTEIVLDYLGEDELESKAVEIMTNITDRSKRISFARACEKQFGLPSGALLQIAKDSQ